MLIQLPDGSWVDPATVQTIAARASDDLTGGPHVGPRVTIWAGDGYFCCEYPTLEEAYAARDKLAAEINAAIAR